MSKKIPVNKGDRYGHLTVVAEVDSTNGLRHIRLVCTCGSIIVRPLTYLRTGDTKSCGCFKSQKASRQMMTHGMAKHPAYSSWKNMIRRCSPLSNNSKSYFDKGVSVCDEWSDSPVEFCNWADRSGFRPDLELDRIDNNLTGDRAYSPENCRWATRIQNSQNTSRGYRWFFGDAEYGSAREAGESLGISAESMRNRCLSENFPDHYRVSNYG